MTTLQNDATTVQRAIVRDMIRGAALLHLRSATFSNPDPAYTSGLLAGLEYVAAGLGLVELTGPAGELNRLFGPDHKVERISQ